LRVWRPENAVVLTMRKTHFSISTLPRELSKKDLKHCLPYKFSGLCKAKFGVADPDQRIVLLNILWLKIQVCCISSRV
jgi:hypothetical protein